MSAPSDARERYDAEWAREEYQRCNRCKTWTDTGSCQCDEDDAQEQDETETERETQEPDKDDEGGDEPTSPAETAAAWRQALADGRRHPCPF